MLLSVFDCGYAARERNEGKAYGKFAWRTGKYRIEKRDIVRAILEIWQYFLTTLMWDNDQYVVMIITKSQVKSYSE